MRLLKFTFSIFVIMGLNVAQAQTSSDLVTPEGENNFIENIATPTDTEDEPIVIFFTWGLSAYPNPTSGGSTTLSFGSDSSLKSGSIDASEATTISTDIKFKIQVFSPQGVMVKKSVMQLGEDLDLDMSDQAPGVYYIKLSNKKHNCVKVSKLIVK